MLAGEQNPIMFPIMEKVRFHNVLLFHFFAFMEGKYILFFLSIITVKHSLAYPPG